MLTISLSEKMRQELKKLASVSEQQRTDLRAMEDAFGKLKQRYEQSKVLMPPPHDRRN
jgi:hypothetical protein